MSLASLRVKAAKVNIHSLRWRLVVLAFALRQQVNRFLLVVRPRRLVELVVDRHSAQVGRRKLIQRVGK
jgi:hypothetical protein